MIKKVRLVRIAQGYPSYKFAALVGIYPNTWHESEMGKRKPSNSVMLRASETSTDQLRNSSLTLRKHWP